MSCDIREYTSIDVGDGASDMTLTAFLGGKEGHCIQFTIGQKYCALSEKQLNDLINAIVKRIMLVDGYTATGDELDNIRMNP